MSKVNQSAFKQLFTEMINQNGDFGKIKANLKTPLKCYVKESYPFFLVTDGYFFVPAYFTKEAVNDFHSKFSNVNIVDLHDKVIVLNSWTLEMRRVNSAEVFTSYGNIEIRLVVSSFKVNLQEKLNPTRFPINLFRDDEFKTIIQNYRHAAIQASLAKVTKNESLPDISKMGDAKKGKIVDGVVRATASKGEEFSDFSFKEGHTAVISNKEIFVMEKGKNAQREDQDHGAAKVVKGAKGKKKAASKSAAKTKTTKASAEPKSAERVAKYTPSKRETPRKASAVVAGKASAKKSVSKKRTPAMASPSGQKQTRTTDNMTMEKYSQYLDWHKKKSGGKASTGKVLGKRSATSKASASAKSTKSAAAKKKSTK